MADADVIIIGSGFGGAITACRLALAGASVIVLERGREWNPTNFPRKPTDDWVFDPADPVKRHGWFDLRMFPHMSVIQGAGVGGGSLVYANISVEAKPETFLSGWPPEITYAALAPHYAEVGRMMEVTPVPSAQWPERTKLLQEAAVKAGWGHRFRPLELAVRFDPAYSLSAPNPYDVNKTKAVVNMHGVAQGTCVHVGECDLGCPVNARNTLDLNYLAVAKAHGAVVKPLHLVDDIRAAAGEFQVKVSEITAAGLVPHTVTGRRVIVAAGSLGSTELLLKARASGGLTHVSDRLGIGWSSNGDFLTPAIHPFRNVEPGRGPTITAAIDLLDGEYMGQQIFVEDGGLPDVARDALERVKDDPNANDFLKQTTATLLPVLESINLVRKVMPWFAQARDAADGTLTLKNNALFLDWDVTASEPTMNAVAAIHRKLAMQTAGLPLTPLPWLVGKNLITPHPLGGCNMGSSAATGVVNFEGQVFGHQGLYVADGAVVPKAIGLNPSRTIGALAEFISRAVIRDL